jgi:hypothetical protein
MERIFTFTITATIEDPAAGGDALSDEELGAAEDAAVEAARAAIVAQYATVEDLLVAAEVAEDLD